MANTVTRPDRREGIYILFVLFFIVTFNCSQQPVPETQEEMAGAADYPEEYPEGSEPHLPDNLAPAKCEHDCKGATFPPATVTAYDPTGIDNGGASTSTWEISSNATDYEATAVCPGDRHTVTFVVAVLDGDGRPRSKVNVAFNPTGFEDASTIVRAYQCTDYCGMARVSVQMTAGCWDVEKEKGFIVSAGSLQSVQLKFKLTTGPAPDEGETDTCGSSAAVCAATPALRLK